jgi:hypothetical protein
MIMLFPSSSLPNFIPKKMSTWFVEMGKISAKDKPLPSWPAVILSEEDPPAFSNQNSPQKTHQNHGNQKYDFEKWLGCYCWENKRITIWIKGVQKTSEALKLPYLDLFNCVLFHDLGHWFNHQAPVFDANGKKRVWPEDSIESYEEYPRYHEVWAQLFTWLYGHDNDEGVLAAFETLEPQQSEPYKAWRRLVSGDENSHECRYEKNELGKSLGQTMRDMIEIVLGSLENSRYSGKNARFDETGSQQDMMTSLENEITRRYKEILRTRLHTGDVDPIFWPALDLF